MPLVIPLKTTVDLDLTKPVSSFLRNTFSELGGDAAQEMARSFDQQRRVACVKALDKNESSLMVLMKYHDQLVKISGKIPFTEADCAVKFTWKDPFTSNKGFMSSGSSKTKIQLCSGDFELMCVRWNVAAMMSQVAAGQEDSDAGIQAAAKYFQQAAGIFLFVKEHMAGVLNKEVPTSDISAANLNTLSQYMLACAQESIYTKAKTGKMKQKTLAQVCQQCHGLYADVAKCAERLSKDLLSYAKLKVQYFKAKTEWHQALQCKDDKKFGEMIARLQIAQATLKNIIKDAPKYKPFNEEIAKELKDAEKENNFIYHDPVPSKDKLEAIKPAVVAKPTPHDKNKLLLGPEGGDVFEAVVPLQVHEANNAFEQKRKEKVDLEISRVRELTTVLNGVMRSMHLPEAIEVSAGSGVPPSILQKAAEIRVKGGYEKINNLAISIPESLQRNRELLDEAKRILTEEAQSDQELRTKFGPKWTRTPSENLTKPLWTDINKYDGILQKAMSADDTVRQKIDQHKQAILLMSQSDAELTQAVPSGAISTVLADNPVIQELKQLCEQAETLKAERDVIESELRNSNASLSSRFMAALADSGAINAEDLTDEELINLYGELTGQINESSDRQESLLANLQRCSQEFSHLKKSGAAEQQRETILASMSAAYDGFMEVNSNLEEGTKFYSDLTQLLLRLQGKCTDLCFARKTEKDELLRDLTSSAVANAATSESGSVSEPSFMNAPPARPPPPQHMQPPTHMPQQPPVSPMATAPPGGDSGAPKPAPRRPPQPQMSGPPSAGPPQPNIQGPPSQYYQPPNVNYGGGYGAPPPSGGPPQYGQGGYPQQPGHQPYGHGQYPTQGGQPYAPYPTQPQYGQGYPAHPPAPGQPYGQYPAHPPNQQYQQQQPYGQGQPGQAPYPANNPFAPNYQPPR